MNGSFKKRHAEEVLLLHCFETPTFASLQRAPQHDVQKQDRLEARFSELPEEECKAPLYNSLLYPAMVY